MAVTLKPRAALVGLMLLPLLAVAAVPADPHGSPMWEYNLQKYLGDDLNVVHNDRVRVMAPPFAEDSAQVPLTVDLAGFTGSIQKVVAWVDLNPIPHLFTYEPGDREARLIAMNFRVQQATTVRAAVLDSEGVWHVGSVYVDAAGGGCTAPSMTAANPDWERNFGTIRGGAFSRLNATRFKANVMHPMDSGMVGNIPAFHIQQVELRTGDADGGGDPVLAMSLSESASENPMFVFELVGDSADLVLWMRDNNGNEFERRFGEG